MTWLGIGLLVSLHALLTGLLLSVWRMTRQMDQVASALKVWDRPEHLTQAAPEPGTTWVQSDAEVAAFEQDLAEDSRHRGDSLRSRRISRASTRASGARPA